MALEAVYEYWNVDGNNEELKKEFKTFFGATPLGKVVMSHHYATRGRPILDECLQSMGQVGLLLFLTVAIDLLLDRNPVILNSVSPEVQAFLDTKGKRKA